MFSGLSHLVSTNVASNSYCEWCGNKSGKQDSRGMCVSCGGNLTRIEAKAKEPYSNEWVDRSGSSYRLGEFGKETLNLFEIGLRNKLDFYQDYHA